MQAGGGRMIQNRLAHHSLLKAAKDGPCAAHVWLWLMSVNVTGRCIISALFLKIEHYVRILIFESFHAVAR